MNKIICALAMGAGVVLSGCETVQPIATTPSGRPEATFVNTTQQEVSSRLSALCMDSGSVVEISSPNQVLCSKTLEGGDAFLATLMVGNRYSTTPERKLRFNVVQMGRDVRVQAYHWIESQMAFGQIQRQELNGAGHFNNVQSALYGIGGR